MDDPLPATKNIECKLDGKAGDESAKPGTQKNCEEKETPANHQGFTLPLIDVLLGLGVLSVVPDILDDLGLHILTIWAWWLSLCLGALAVVHLVIPLWPKSAKRIWLIFIASVVVTASGFGFWTYTIARPSSGNDFFIKPTVKVFYYRNPLFWLVNKDRVYPLHITMSLRLKNMKSEKVTVENYWLEAQRENGVWAIIPDVGVGDGELFAGAITNAMKIRVVDFYTATRSGPIEAKSWIPITDPGVIFIQAPSWVSVTTKWRMHIELIGGANYVQQLEFPNIPTMTNGPHRSEKLFEAIGIQRRDLSKLKSSIFVP